MHYVFLFVKFDLLTEHNAIGSRGITAYVHSAAKGGGGVNRGMQIRRSVRFFRQIRQSANIFYQIRKVNVNATFTSNFAQIVKKVACLMTIIQYNSNNSLTPEFK